MAFYIAFNNFASFLDESNSALDSIQDIRAVADSVEKAILEEEATTTVDIAATTTVLAGSLYLSSSYTLRVSVWITLALVSSSFLNQQIIIPIFHFSPYVQTRPQNPVISLLLSPPCATTARPTLILLPRRLFSLFWAASRLSLHRTSSAHLV